MTSPWEGFHSRFHQVVRLACLLVPSRMMLSSPPFTPQDQEASRIATADVDHVLGQNVIPPIALWATENRQVRWFTIECAKCLQESFDVIHGVSTRGRHRANAWMRFTRLFQDMSIQQEIVRLHRETTAHGNDLLCPGRNVHDPGVLPDSPV
jgi:hypothetical protein